MLQDIVDNSFEAAKKQKAAQGGYITLGRDIATIPLPGIDVPFHSRYLWPGVLPFRACKRQVYLVELARLTDLTRVDLSKKINSALAYQFASPVRWIETQDLLFTHYKFERLIKLGPGPTLTGMATRTLKAKYEASDDSISLTRAIYCHARNPKEIYYQFEDEPEAAPESTTASEPAVAAPVAAVAPLSVAAPAPSAGPAAAIADEPLKAVDTLRVIIAQKLKKVEEVPLSKSIKDLVGGKSTLQNEILGDLNLEFTAAPEKGEGLPLDDRSSLALVRALGKHTTGLISHLTSIKG